MKKNILSLLALLLVCSYCATEAKAWDIRHKYRNFTGTVESMALNDNKDALQFGLGGAFVSGYSFTLHDRPLLRTIFFSIDATWVDMEYVGFKAKDFNADIHKVNYSMHVGLGMHISPVNNFYIHTYLRYAPTGSSFVRIQDETYFLDTGFTNNVLGGIALSWKAISLGVEYRVGVGTYKNQIYYVSNEDYSTKPNGEVFNAVSGTLRLYLGLRF